MKITTKVIWLLAGSLLLTCFTFGGLFIWQLDKAAVVAVTHMENLSTDSVNRIRGDRDGMHREFMEQRKEYLRSQVQTTMGVLAKAYQNARDPEKLKLLYTESLQNAVNTAFGVLEAIEAEQGLTLEEKQQKAVAIVKALRYGPQNEDYFWINDMQPAMVMHPYKPELDGTDLSENKDPNGKKLFMEFVRVCREKGQGFVNYMWLKYGAEKPQPKLSFVRLFKPWNWVIGTGVYLEVAEEKLKTDAAALVGALRYGKENKDYFWINDMHPTMVMHPYKPELDGTDLSEDKDPDGKRLFIEMVKVCRDSGEGFVDYMWPKYGADRPQPKLSYVQLFKEWDWVIGTGLYIDDIDALVDQKMAETAQKAKDVSGDLKEQIGASQRQIMKNSRDSMVMGGVILVVIFTLLVVAAFVLTRRGITRPITRITRGIDEGAERVAAASAQVSSASAQLAEGSSSQAAALEQTSSSLEEMASMTKRNAEYAAHADSLTKEVNHVMAQAMGSMTQLTASMEEISGSSVETSKIIKTIDEIAFQTNLLALNAAVEAARAGEAGAGFAVVADEVRNLAMRAAEAAKNTASLIEGSVKKIQEGTELVERTSAAFEEVARSSAKVGELVGEIAAASNEQSQGIEQVNRAVAEMDRVVQQNAASAEENAGASRQMSTQAGQMKDFVHRLVDMVGGGANGAGNHVESAAAKTRAAVHKAAPKPVPRNALYSPVVPGGKQIAPEQVIPLDKEEDFRDF